MFTCKLFNTNDFLDAIFLLLQISETSTMKCSMDKFTLSVSNNSNDHGSIDVAFEMMPEFFNYFFSDQISSSQILLKPLFDSIVRHKIRTYSSFVLTHDLELDLNLKLDQVDDISLTFRSSEYSEPLFGKLKFLPLSIEDDGDEVDEVQLGTFFSIDDKQFGQILTKFDRHLVDTILTKSQVKFFSKEIDKEIILFEKDKECMIGGVAEGDEIEFLISFNPIRFFRNLTFRSERVKFHKTTKSHTAIVVPLGLNAEFTVLYSNRI